MKKIHLFILSILSGVFFTIGWPQYGYPAFLFSAFIPLLIIEDYIFRNRQDFSKFSVFFYTYPAFLIWNVLTTWWVWNSTPAAILAWTLNAMFMGIVMNVFHLSRRNLYQHNYGYFMLVIFWITFEYIHLNWSITWTWLNLGNGFAVHYTWIQWYEFTGTHGGSVWIIVINIFLFKALNNLLLKQTTKRKILYNAIAGLALIIFPIIISYIIYFGYEEKKNPINVIATQPNLDPYGEQYSVPPAEVVDLNLKLAKSLMDGNPTIIAAPESTIQEDIWERNLQWSTTLKQIRDFIQENPEVKIIIGASTYDRLEEGEKIPNSARYHEGGKFYYDHFNTAFYLDSSESIQIHHKSKLTPGVEYMPSGGIFSFLEDLSIDLGGTVGSLGISENPGPFNLDENIKIAPIICYESIFGEYCTDFVRQGADLFIIITNDGWWGNTPGHRQHLLFTSLRSIETRRSIGRSANTGISCFTNQRGDIFQATQYWEQDVIKQELNLNDKVTFYAQFGDYFGRVSAFLSVVFILLSVVFGIRRKKGLI